MKNTKEKKYAEYKKERSEQLDLFSMNDIFESKRDKYSGTVELYDMVPKYFHGDVEKVRTQDGLLKSLVRDFVYKKQKMTLRVSPAQIETKSGEKAFYPSQREEIMEDILRKFATDSSRNELLDDRLSVRFTLYELWKELRKIRHPYDYNEIKESLEILSKTNIEIKTHNNKVTFSSNMFETFGVVDNNVALEDIGKILDEKQQKEYSERVVYFVRFNSLVSESIRNKTWKILNYEQCMKYKKFISRWLHKRISHMFITNNIELPYNILLSTIIRDSGMTEYARISDNMSQVQKCFAEMISIGSIDRYEMEKIYSEERKNKLIDVKFSIYTSYSFFDDMRLGNLIFKSKAETKCIDAEHGSCIINADKEELKVLLKDFNLSDSDLNKILSYKKDKSFSDIKNNILCAITYINKEQSNNKKCNEMAIIVSAIKNDWNNQDLLNDLTADSGIDNNKQMVIEKLLANISSEEYKLISQLFIKYFGEDIYISWLSKLNFVSIDHNTLTLSCDNEFVADVIKKDYLNGFQVKNEDGTKYWHKKGIKQIVEEVVPNIAKVDIK